MLNQAQSNKDIRAAAAAAGVFLWQIAEAIGVTDGTFSRKLRRELPDDEKEAEGNSVKEEDLIRDYDAEEEELVQQSADEDIE